MAKSEHPVAGAGADQLAPGGHTSAPNPEHAWKTLSITNEWVRHGDSKTGVTLAFTGATATILFSLVRDHQPWTCLLIVTTALAAAALICSVVASGVALLPRLTSPTTAVNPAPEESVGGEEVENLLYFGVVDNRFGSDRPTYLEVLSLLTSDNVRLTRQIASQIHANSRVAAAKFRCVNWAIKLELAAAGLVAFVALLVATGW